MALIEEKSIDGFGNKLRLYAEETSYSTQNNTSEVHAYLELYVVGSVASSNVRVKVSGASEVNLGYRSWGSGTHRLIDGYYTANHNADGSGSTFVDGYFYSNIGNWGFGGTLQLTKLDRYATITSAPNFNDEENPTITYRNPLGENVSLLKACISFTGGSDNIPYRDIPKTGTSYTFEFTQEEKDILTSSILTTNSRKLFFYIRTRIGNNTYHSYVERTFTIVNGNPVFVDYDFEDINNTTKTLTGSTKNNVINVNGYSNIQATITTTNKAEAVKQATMSKYRLAIGDSSTDIAYSDNEDVSGVLNNASNGTYNLYAIDSRNNSTLVIKQATSVVNYENIYLNKQNCSIVRDDGGVGDNAILTINGTFWNNNFGVVSNSIKSVSYRLKKTNSSTWITGTTTITPTTSGNTFSFTDYIASDNQDTTWDLDSSYNVEITVSDELSTTNVELILNSAVPTISLDENGVGIMCAYDNNIGGALQIGSSNINVEELAGIKGEIGWSNSSPSSSFTAQNITLDDDNYDTLLWIFKRQASQSYIAPLIYVPKGMGGLAMTLDGSLVARSRAFNYVDSTTYSVDVASSPNGTTNEYLIPLYVIKIKTGLFS